MNKDCQLGLLYLLHMLIGADGDRDSSELQAFAHILEKEKIEKEIHDEFEKSISSKKEREIYQAGIELMNRCSKEDKLKVFVLLYKMSEVDGRVHVKEIKLLLYSIKSTGVEFEDVVRAASNAPSYF